MEASLQYYQQSRKDMWSLFTGIRISPFFDWICDQCCLCYVNDECLETELKLRNPKISYVTAKHSSLLLHTLDTLKNVGVIFTKEVRGEFREILFNLDVDSTHHACLCNKLTKYLNSLTKGWFKAYISPEGSDSLGRAIIDESKQSVHSLAFMFRMKRKEWETQNAYLL